MRAFFNAMKLPKVLLKHSAKIEDLVVSFNPNSTRKSTGDIDQLIEAEWQSALMFAQREDRKLWNSVTYRLNACSVLDGKVVLDLGLTDYKTYIGLRGYDLISELGEEYLTKTVYLESLLVTTDGFYVLGELSGKTMETQSVDTIGGVLSHSELEVTDAGDLKTALLTEFKEEANIPEQYVDSIQLTGITLDEGYKVGIHFVTRLTITSDRLKSLFSEGTDSELKGLVFVPSDEIFEYLKGMGKEYALLPYLLT